MQKSTASHFGTAGDHRPHNQTFAVADRPTFFASVAGRIRVGLFKPNVGGRLKRHAYRRGLPIEPGVHRVEEILRFADLLGSHLELIQGASYEPGICRCHFLRE